MNRIVVRKKHHNFELLEYNNFRITHKLRTKYLRFYESYNNTHINYCKENDETIKKVYPCVKYKRLSFLNDTHIELMDKMATELKKRYCLNDLELIKYITFYKKIETNYPEDNEYIKIYKINNDELFIQLGFDDKLFLWKYNVKIVNNKCTLRIIKESTEYIYSSDMGWHSLKCICLENNFDKVFDLIKNNFDKKYWIDIIIKVFPIIPYYQIDDSPEECGIKWLNKNVPNIE